jgi:hypothetical protein
LGKCKTTCIRDTSTVAVLSVLIFSTHVLVLESLVGSWSATSLRVSAAVRGCFGIREATSERSGAFDEECRPSSNERRR